MTSNIVGQQTGKAYTKLLFPRDGGAPKTWWILEEREDGWLVEPVRLWGNADLPVKQEFLSSRDWAADQTGIRPRLPDIDFDKE